MSLPGVLLHSLFNYVLDFVFAVDDDDDIVTGNGNGNGNFRSPGRDKVLADEEVNI